MAENNKDYPNTIIAGLWETTNGHFHSMPIDEKARDVLMKILDQKGGKFLIRKRSAESLRNASPKSPVAYIEYVPQEEVERFAKKQVEKMGL